MAKNKEVRVSFEKLLKVWLSKLDADEEELVEEDLIWFNSMFDTFLRDENLNEFINLDGRYDERELDKNAIIKNLELSYEFSSNDKTNWLRFKIQEPALFEYYKSLNDIYIIRESKYNLLDIYFRVFKKLYIQAEFKDLIRTKKSVVNCVNLTVLKIALFEKDKFNAKSFLGDFYEYVLRNVFTEKDLKEVKPDSVFISTVLFISTFNIYYNDRLKFNKIQIIRRYLLSTWINLNDIGVDGLIDDFLNSLSEMTLSNSSYREIDLYEIRASLKEDDRDSEFYRSLNLIKTKADHIITTNDIEQFQDHLAKSRVVKIPEYVSDIKVEYFLKSEEESAVAIYKFRQMQYLVLEFLGLTIHFKGKAYFFQSFHRLRKNEQWSNHQNFFPKSLYDVLIWLIVFSEVKREMNFRVLRPSFGYRYLGDISVFLFKDCVFDEGSIINALELRGLALDSSFLNSMAGVSTDLLNNVEGNILLTDEEKEKVILFLESLSIMFGGQIERSESLTPIDPIIFDNLISEIKDQYRDRSVIYFLSQNLSPFSRGSKYIEELKTFVIASELQYRKYLIPNWYSGSSGLSGSFSRRLVEDEILQFDYRFLEKRVPLKTEELKRESVQRLVEKYGEDALFVFRNAYPGFWLGNERSKSKVNGADKPISFSYNTYDRNSELIIIPKSSMSIHYLYDGRLRNLQFLEGILMWELVDLGGGNRYSEEVSETIEKFRKNSDKYSEDLEKFFWIRIVAKTKIVIKDKSSILRFKLNPYGE